MFCLTVILSKVVQQEVDRLRGNSVYKRVQEMRVAVEGRYRLFIGMGLLDGVIAHHFNKYG